MAINFSVAVYCGHGKSTDGSFDPGTTYNGKTEAALMLPITQSIRFHIAYNDL